MCERYVHHIDPIIFEAGPFYLWWYGAGYTLGLLGAFLWLRRVRSSLEYDLQTVYTLSIMLAAGALLGGRLVEVVFYEWSYYSEHPWRVAWIWLGGMSTHGILVGATLAVWAFCRRFHKPFLPLADELAIAAAYIMGVGRLGNFIDGQIAGSITDVCWGVKFPDLEGYRHPVVLYDGIKNLLLVPALIYLRNRQYRAGVVFGHFILWYGFLRIFVDFFREYRTDFAGFPPGQEFNVLMTLLGLAVLAAVHRVRGPDAVSIPRGAGPGRRASRVQRVAFVMLALLPLVIPSDWTQDVPGRYGARHDGLEYSALYPRLEAPTGPD